jgi:hypothetical protein
MENCFLDDVVFDAEPHEFSSLPYMASRRSRISELTADQLFWLGRAHLFNQSLQKAHELLQVAAERGHEEATWLLGHFGVSDLSVCHVQFDTHANVSSHRELGYYVYVSTMQMADAQHYPDWGNLRPHVRRIVAEEKERTPLGTYACARLGLTGTTTLRATLMREAAQRGEPMAKASVHWLPLAEGAPDRRIDMVREAAECYVTYALVYALRSKAKDNYYNNKDTELAFWALRDALLGSSDKRGNGIQYARKCASDVRGDTDALYLMGKELDGYRELYPPIDYGQWRRGSEWERDLVSLYRRTMHACRRSALFVVLSFRLLMGRDIAGIIAKKVYATRCDTQAWHCGENPDAYFSVVEGPRALRQRLQ